MALRLKGHNMRVTSAWDRIQGLGLPAGVGLATFKVRTSEGVWNRDLTLATYMYCK